MIVPARVAPPVALLVALLTVTVLYNAGVAAAPRDFFGADDDVVLLLPGTGAVTSRGNVPEALAKVLLTLEDVTAVSPEVVVLTSVDGHSVLARGVSAPSFLAIEEGEVLRGRLPVAHFEALAGSGLARLLDVDVGDAVLVPGSLRQGAARVEIVGVFDAPGLPADELLLSVPVARGLADLPPETVHLIRVETPDPTNITRLVSSVQPTFTYSDVALSAQEVLQNEPVILTGNLTNWGLQGGAKDVAATVGSTVVGRVSVFVPPRTTVPFSLPLTLTSPGDFTVQLNPSLDVRVRAPTARFEELPHALPAGEETEVRVLAEDEPLEGVEVALAGARARTDAEGVARIVPRALGPQRIVASDESGVMASAEVFVTTRENLTRSAAEAVALEVDRVLLRTNESLHVNVTLVGVGGYSGAVTVNVTVGDRSVPLSMIIRPGQRVRAEVDLGTLPEGVHTVSVEGFPRHQRVEAITGDPAIESLLRAREAARGQASLAPRVGADASEYVERIVRNVSVAAAALSLAAAALVSLALVAVWSRHLAERAPSIGILKSLGATREQVQWLVLRAACLHAGVAAVAGVASGIALAFGIDAMRLVRAFGHQISPRPDAWLVVAIVALALILNALIARAIAGRIYDEPAGELIEQRILRGDGSTAPTLREALAEARA